MIVRATSAQYKIDLSKTTPPAVESLKLGHTGPEGKEIRVNNLYMDEGGIPQLPVMGEIHYNRMDHLYWRDALLKMKASGIDIVATYCIRSLHEEFEGELSWEGQLNLRRFIELCNELDMKVHLRIGPMEKSVWIRPADGNIVKRLFTLNTFSSVERGYLRYTTPESINCTLNNKEVKTTSIGGYQYADVTPLLRKDTNTIAFSLPEDKSVMAEIEVLLKNGKRIIWNTGATWTSSGHKQPVIVASGTKRPSAFAPEEHLAIYEVNAPAVVCSDEETRMYISYKGEVPGNCVTPVISDIQIKQEHRFELTNW